MFFALLIGIIIASYFYVRQRFQYFANHGIPYEPGYFPLGSIESWRLFTGQASPFKIADKVANRHPTKEIIPTAVRNQIPLTDNHETQVQKGI